MGSTNVQPASSLTVGEVFHDMRFTRNHLLAGSVLFVTFVVEAWEQMGLIYVSHGITADFGISNSQLGLALSAVAFGMVPGTLLWSPLVERRGRKLVSIASLLLYSVLALLAAFAPSYPFFLACRFLSGVAFGGVYAVTFPYFIELLPTKWRGQGAVALSIGFPIGTLLCILVSSTLGGISWRVVAVVAALAGLWAFVVWKVVPESPYWLVKRGEQERARSVLSWFGADIGPDRELSVADDDSDDEDAARPRIRHMRPGLLLTLVLVVSFTFSWGYWGLQTWLPTLLQHKGLSLSESLGFVALSQVVSIPGYLLAAGSTRRFGRRGVFVVFAIASAAGALVFALASSSAQMYAGNLILAFFSLGAWGIWNTWSGEVLPTRIRGVGYAASTAAILLAQTLAVPAVGWMMDHQLSFATVVISIVVALGIAIVTVIPIPETEGRALR